MATLSLQDHPHLSSFSLISLLQLHAAPQFKYLLPQAKWLSFCDHSVRSVSAYRSPACPSRLHHSAVAEDLWLLSGLCYGKTKTGAGDGFGDSRLAYRESVHQTFHQADLRLPLIWQVSYFPAFFSSLLVCSPFFMPGCWGLPIILSHFQFPPAFPSSLVRFSDSEVVVKHIGIPKTILFPLLRCHRLFIILMCVELES